MNHTKLIGIILVGLFFTASTTGILQANSLKDQPLLSQQQITFSTPTLVQNDEYLQIHLPETNAYLKNLAKPLLPAKTEIYTFPFGTKILDITVQIGEIQTMNLHQKLEPCPIPLPLDTEYATESRMIQTLFENDATYTFTGFYPSSWFDYQVKIGLDEDNIRKTFVILQTYPVRYAASDNIIQYTDDIQVDIHYELPTIQQPATQHYDFLIISGYEYLDALETFVNHKENRGIATKLVSVDDIDTTGADLAEQIKYYIKQAIETWDITSVLLVGGHRSFLGFNQPSLQIPLRYVELDDTGEPNYVSDVYYSDIYAYDPGSNTSVFSSWDTDQDELYGEWYYLDDDVTDKQDEVDLIPDVHLGRWACRTVQEAAIMVNKVITYENTLYSEENWFKRMITLTGDDFQDQRMLNISWDTTGLSGTYTIHATSTNQNDETSIEDTVTVIVDHTQSSNVTFSENDHLTTGLIYPNIPVAEITVPSEGNVLGMDNVYNQNPPNAYAGYRWTPINYTDHILKIQGKSYNPQPHTEAPINTTIKVWITNEEGTTIFGPIIKEFAMYFEGEWEAQKAFDYMPSDFEHIKLWTSMGTFHGSEENVHDAVDDIVHQLSQGSGFLYIAGHANPMIYANHYPGIPGGRSNGDVRGLLQFNPFRGFTLTKMFPLRELTNDEKQPVLALSGCHPCQLDVNFLRLFSERKYAIWFGTYAWESLGWWLTRLENRGTIATIGPTALGYGGVGPWSTKVLGGWLWPEFFRQYGQEGKTNLGEAWTQTLKNYITEFGPNLDLWDTKTVESMVLLGDPTLTIG
jgi:hypothetical protein